jgi:hypothetical protein
MANLIILIPFPANPNCDLDQGAADLQQRFNLMPPDPVLGDNVNREIHSVVILNFGSQYACGPDDCVILFAHGGQLDTGLSNNQGANITMNNAIQALAQIGAGTTARVLFMCCFSALDGHIAAVWAAGYPNQSTFGGFAAIATLFNATRHGIRGVCLALGER